MTQETQKHLWEVDHNYYCSADGEFYSTWQDFIDEWGDADEDYNLLFRFDCMAESDWWDEDEPLKENEKVCRFSFVLQRKDVICTQTVKVLDSDEPAIREYLQKKFDYLKQLWMPIGAKPKTVCLCGSTRFSQAYQDANLRETIAGNIVLTIGADMKSDAALFASMSSDELEALKIRLDELHKRKIDLADEILVLNVDGYIGSSTKSEIEYAEKHGKVIRYLE